MNFKQELQTLNNRLDKYRGKMVSARQRNDRVIIAQFQTEIDSLTQKIAHLKSQQGEQMSNKGSSIKALAFNRTLTKAEQADMGKLKKSVRGLVVVHPMTAIGREIGVTTVTGFAPTKF